MSEVTYQVKFGCSYGAAGSLVQIEGDLTDRQKTMLAEYRKPVIKDTSESDALKAENEALKAEIAALKKGGKQGELEVATPPAAKK